jgi:hypothetical protein
MICAHLQHHLAAAETSAAALPRARGLPAAADGTITITLATSLTLGRYGMISGDNHEPDTPAVSAGGG